MHFTDPNHPLNPFYRVENSATAFQYYAKPNTTWEQMDAFLEKLWKKDRHMDWQGFGTIGEKDFTVVVVRKSCAPHRCDLVLCDGCGDEVCDSTLEENDDGDVVCENCRDEEEEEDEVETYVCHGCCRYTNQTEREREELDPFCRSCAEGQVAE